MTDPSRVPAAPGPHGGPRPEGLTRQEVGAPCRLRPVLEGQHSAGRHRGQGQGQHAGGRCQHAACAELRRTAGRALRVRKQRRRLRVPRRHAGHRNSGGESRPRPVSAARRVVGPPVRPLGLDARRTGHRRPGLLAQQDAALLQLNAINRTVEAIAQGRKRILLVMAAGTGKIYTAFQVIYRLWKSNWRADKPSGPVVGQKRILLLADRKILIDQTMVNDFRPLKGAMAKLSPNAKGVDRVDAATGKHLIEDLDVAVSKTTKQMDKSYEIYSIFIDHSRRRSPRRNFCKDWRAATAKPSAQSRSLAISNSRATTVAASRLLGRQDENFTVSANTPSSSSVSSSRVPCAAVSRDAGA